MPSGRRLGITLMACIAAGAPAFAQQQPGPADARAGSVSPPDEAPRAAATPLPAGVTGWGLFGAPVATSGSLAYDFRGARAGNEGHSSTQLVTGTINARTYLYEPWFATLQGSVGLTNSVMHSSFNDEGFGEPTAATRAGEQFATGTARLALFPRSRFPFEVHVEHTDSRIDSNLAPTLDFRTSLVGLSQRYRPASGLWSLAGTFEHREQSGSGFRDLQDTLAGDFTTRWKDNDLSLDASLSRARRQLDGDTSDFRSLVARHQYSPAGPLSLTTTVNFTQTREYIAAAPTDLSILQWSSVGLWHRQASALSLTGAVRAVLLRDATAGHDIDNLAATAGASYDVSKNLRATGNATVTTTRSGGSDALGLSTSGGLAWQADTLQFGSLRYDRFASATISAAENTSSSGGSEHRTVLAAEGGHSVARVWLPSQRSSIALTASETAIASRTRGGETPGAWALPHDTFRELLHTAGATWNVSADNKNAYARLSFSDSREIGGAHARFQLWNFQLSGTFEMNRWRSLTGDLTLQRAQQRSSDQYADPGAGIVRGETSTTRNVAGEVTYRHGRLFGVPGLRFTSRVKLARDVLNQPGTLPSLPDRETRMWESRLDWSVGRLELGVLLRLSEIENRRRDFVMFRAQRNFGE